MALNGLNCAAVPLRIYSLTHSLDSVHHLCDMVKLAFISCVSLIGY